MQGGRELINEDEGDEQEMKRIGRMRMMRREMRVQRMTITKTLDPSLLDPR